ncbi:MAG TPA: pepsin/retropepsin-like aspartic protease family protein [Thermoanaerobaculia bacterium]|nr:pepsin/retropepsin-like aspartic protease family protein [Thermoanaerobaculia bacterium]HQR66732.1 pepsin/retropepsin-like aspartic protease family protein [Thermoanaerobaculia bacterium]
MLTAPGPRRAAAVLAFLGMAGACTFSREKMVLRLDALAPPAPGAVNIRNVEEKLQRGYIPEVVAFLTGPEARKLDPEKGAHLLLQAKLETADFAVAEAIAGWLLARPLRMETRADVEWLRSQAAYWRGDFGAAARSADASRAAGRGVPEGWITFLRSGEARKPYEGPVAGERTTLRFHYGRPNLIRLAVRVNGEAAGGMILDSGASLSLLTEAAAARLGVEPVPGAVAPARGLHQKEIPMRLGWARSVTLGTLTFRDVPFGILPDGALTFETEALGLFSPDGVLGVHLMKELDWRIEMAERRIQAIRLDPDLRRGGPGQTIFLRRMKPMIRVSFNRQPWSLFLLDTGSEPTMVTPEGLVANQYVGYEPSAPITLEGIGKTQVSWSKVSDITLGLGRWGVWFKNLVVNEGGDAIGDGIVGMSFLSPFDLELRFSLMTLSLERSGGAGTAAREPFSDLPETPRNPF